MKYRYNLIRSEWGWTLTESGYRLNMGEIQRLHEMLSTLRGGQNDIDILYTLGYRQCTVHGLR